MALLRIFVSIHLLIVNFLFVRWNSPSANWRIITLCIAFIIGLFQNKNSKLSFISISKDKKKLVL